MYLDYQTKQDLAARAERAYALYQSKGNLVSAGVTFAREFNLRDEEGINVMWAIDKAVDDMGSQIPEAKPSFTSSGIEWVRRRLNIAALLGESQQAA